MADTTSSEHTYRGVSQELEPLLTELSELLASPALDPDPIRSNWHLHDERVDRVRRLAHDEVPSAFDAFIARPDSAQGEVGARRLSGELLAGAVALLWAAGRDDEARLALERARRICSGTAPAGELLDHATIDLVRFTATMRAWWLLARGREKEADRVAKAARRGAPVVFRRAADEVLDAARPIKGSPSLFTLNGFGTRVYGHHDVRDDGTYLTLRYACALFVPIVPLDAFRVQDAGGDGWYFLARQRLPAWARLWRLGGIAALVIAVVIGVLVDVPDHPGADRTPALVEAIRAADQAAEQATSADRDALIERYAAILAEYPEATDDQARHVVNAIVALVVADVPAAPKTAEDLAAIDLAMFRFMSLPSRAQAPEIAGAMVEHLRGWADSFGEDSEGLQARFAVLGHALPLTAAVDRARFESEQRLVRRALADQLRDDWPLEALRLVASLEDVDDLARTASTLHALPPDPLVWAELRPEVEGWISIAMSHRELEADVDRVRARLGASTEAIEDPARVQLLQARERDLLEAAHGEDRHDQGFAIALADVHLAEGRAATAVELLEGLGSPGTLVSEAQSLLASAYLDVGRAADADALLDKVVSARLPAFRFASRTFDAKASALQASLLNRAQRGEVPPEIDARFAAAKSDAEAEVVFREWVQETMTEDAELVRLRARYEALSSLVPMIVQLGTIRVRRAESEKSAEREALLAAAERTFLSIATEGRGTAGFHLGLAEVYDRLGRPEDAEAQLDELLAQNDPEIELMVVGTYRELGRTGRAREIAESVYERRPEPIKGQAAMMRALLASDPTDRETWLRRSDTSSTPVKLALLEVEGEKALLAGDRVTADAKYAEAYRGWASMTDTNASAANNAAVAALSRYPCTGDVAPLRDARKLLERARRALPNDPVVVTNLAYALEHEATLDVLEPYVHVHELHATASQGWVLLDALRGGPKGDAVRSAARRNPLVRRTRDTFAQLRAMAPASEAGYAPVGWAGFLRDEAELRALVEKIEASDIDTTDTLRSRAQYATRERDELDVKRLEASLAWLEHVRDSARRKHAPTIAATWILEAEARHDLAVLLEDPDMALAAIAAAETATATWPGFDASDALTATNVLAAVLAAAKEDPDVDELFDATWRLGGTTGMLLALRDDPKVLARVREEASFEAALVAARATAVDELGSNAWLLGMIAGDETLEANALAALRAPQGALTLRASVVLDPESTAARVSEAIAAAPR
jgi:tetratricopeptide (TPR) repeat protein